MSTPLQTHLRTALIAATALLATACEKEIEMDYHVAEKLYVVEATLSQSEARVRVSTTRPITQNSRDGIYIDDATVVITSEDGIADTLTPRGNGLYTSTAGGFEGVEYTADVKIGQQHFASTSVMQPMPQLTSFRFVWKKVLTGKVLFGDMRLQDLPGQRNYYFLHLYRNNIGYRWAVIDDSMNPGGELQQLFACTTEDQMKKGTDSDVINERDEMRLEVRAIDRRSYDYLYSMQIMDNTGTNPTQNFTGGCLGYFSAFSVVTWKDRFYLDEVEEED